MRWHSSTDKLSSSLHLLTASVIAYKRNIILGGNLTGLPVPSSHYKQFWSGDCRVLYLIHADWNQNLGTQSRMVLVCWICRFSQTLTLTPYASRSESNKRHEAEWVLDSRMWLKEVCWQEMSIQGLKKSTLTYKSSRVKIK